jgi:hypothetical protein
LSIRNIPAICLRVTSLPFLYARLSTVIVHNNCLEKILLLFPCLLLMINWISSYVFLYFLGYFYLLLYEIHFHILPIFLLVCSCILLSYIWGPNLLTFELFIICFANIFLLTLNT